MNSRTATPILGISCDFHDAAAAVVIDGEVVAAAEEERFTRVKHDASLPRHAIEWCLSEAGISGDSLAGVTFYEKPLSTYERILMTHAKVGPVGFPRLASAIGQWSRSKLWVGYRIERVLRDLGIAPPRLTYAEHHQSHAAAAFYPSPYERAAILTFDGLGEWATSSIAWGSGHRIEVRREMRFPDSIGLLYSALTAFIGFEVNGGEFKLMGLAPYGSPRYLKVLKEQVVDIHDDGSIRLDQRWFAYRAGKSMYSPRLAELLDGPARSPGAPLRQREADIAASAQALVEEIVLAVGRFAYELTRERTACLAGGVALNCVANRRLLEEGPFDEVWVQPAAGDSGSAAGAALWNWHQVRGNPRTAPRDGMSGALLGPAFDDHDIELWLDETGVEYEVFLGIEELCEFVSEQLSNGSIVGWFRGRMEFGPRALGHRSILADPRDPTMIDRLNRAVKQREGFRPFAPAVPAEEADTWFDLTAPSPYMLFTAPVAQAQRVELPDQDPPEDFAEQLSQVRSTIPACTHVDYSARVQTVSKQSNPDFHALLSAFGRRTGCPVLINTSFNVNDEPIVRSPADAYRCYLATDIDLLVLGNLVIRRAALQEAE